MSKRFNREGSYRQRPDGRWEGRLSYTDEHGARRRLSFYGADRDAVVAKVKNAAERLRDGEPAKDSAMTVGAWCLQWCETSLQASDRKETTKSLMRSLLRKHVISEKIGGVPLAKLKPSHFDEWLLTLKGKRRNVKGEEVPALTASSLQRIFRVLSVALDGAVRDEQIARNPAKRVTQPRADHREVRVLSPDEVRNLLKAAKQLDDDPRGRRSANYPLFALIAATGLRKGEALALRWSDIDFELSTLTVRGTLARVNGALVVQTPKTATSWRVLPLTASLATILRQHRLRQLQDRMTAANIWQDTGHVFTTETGLPRDPRGVLRSMEAIARRAGLTDVTVHTLRHAAATAMLDGGVHLKAVSQLLGHRDIQITGNIYAHLTQPTAQRALDGLSEAIGI